MNDLKEIKISSEQIFKGKLLDVRKDEVVLPNNTKATREWIKHPGASCCIPIIDDKRILMVKQYRYAVKEESIELPAGKIDTGETPDICAFRELEEETGYKAQKLTFLTSIYPAIGFTDEKIWVYLAENLEKTYKKPDIDEFVEVISVDLMTAMNMVQNGKISDSKTIIGLMWLDKYLKDKLI